ncbi:membrane-associated sensor domain-containing protein [Aeromonas sp. NJAU223]|uniref:GGDEF domain-containing protein n=1 Tax=Aeromonas sp. NJAU223 TaxID=3115650 RepID=UPI003DA91326
MLSVEQRRLASHFDHHLDDARLRALDGGLRWFWVINLIAILFLLTRYYIYWDAHLAVSESLPWYYEWQLIAMGGASLLLPLGWRWLSRQPTSVWQPCLWGLALMGGLAWALVGYSLSFVDLKAGFSFVFNMMSLLLLTSLIAFYCDRWLLYSLALPPLLFLMIRATWSPDPFVLVNILATVILLIVLETGRRMLNRWFELAVEREHDNLVLARKMDAMANSDPLTGVANRRFFATVSEQVLKEVQVQHERLALILLDVDFFKRFNDRYGHQRGDECLIAVADCLSTSLREPTDVVARYGGEEFVILLYGADAAAAEAVAKRIAGELALCAIPHADSSVSEQVTASQGIALWRSGESIDELLVRADEALYRVKDEGRNGYQLAP